jgi:histidinol-phosphate aminotransferase
MKSIVLTAPHSPIARLRAYRSVSPTARFAKSADAALKLDWNESTIPPSPVVLDRLSAFLATGTLNWYADPTARALRQQLSKYTGRPVSQIQVFNGSDSALDHVARAFVTSGDHVVICSPCYDNFRVFVAALGADVEHVLAPSPFTAHVRGLVGHIRPTTRLVYVCNPNNPTGRMYTLRQIETILRHLTGGVMVVDEAYFEFAGVTTASLLDRYENLVITRSFSKAFSLAGVRCGYALATERLARYVNRLRNGKDVNAFAQIAALASLDDLPYMRAYVDEVRRSRAWLVKHLRTRGYAVVSSPANFILVKVDAPAQLLEQLKAKGIYIRDRSYLPQLDHCVRVTVGTRDHCRRFLAVLDEINPSREAGRRR